jgi:hypothetical protein
VRLERRRFLPIGHEFREAARVHDRAGELVRPDFTRFLENVDIFGGEFRLGAGGIVLRDQSR